MSSSLRRGAFAASAIAFSIASLAACGAGSNAQTLQIRPDNAATSVGDIEIQNAVVITQPDPESTGPAVVSATIFNNGETDQTLDVVKVEGVSKGAELSPGKNRTGTLTVPAGGSIVIGGENNPAAVLVDSNEAINDGANEKVTFTFSKTGDVSLEAFVVPAQSYFSEWGPSDIPTPTETASATPTAGATATGTESPAAGASASPSVTASQ